MTIKRSRKPLYITLALAIYAAVMAVVNLDTLTVYHDSLRYFGTLGAEIIILCLLYFFLHRREQLRREREADQQKDQGDNN